MRQRGRTYAAAISIFYKAIDQPDSVQHLRLQALYSTEVLLTSALYLT